jgi:hypothetical protein
VLAHLEDEAGRLDRRARVRAQGDEQAAILAGEARLETAALGHREDRRHASLHAHGEEVPRFLHPGNRPGVHQDPRLPLERFERSAIPLDRDPPRPEPLVPAARRAHEDRGRGDRQRVADPLLEPLEEGREVGLGAELAHPFEERRAVAVARAVEGAGPPPGGPTSGGSGTTRQ